MTRDVEAARLRRRQQVQRRFAVVAFPLVLLGLVVRYGLHQDWGQLLFLVGLLINLVGFAAAPLLHPKPLCEE